MARMLGVNRFNRCWHLPVTASLLIQHQIILRSINKTIDSDFRIKIVQLFAGAVHRRKPHKKVQRTTRQKNWLRKHFVCIARLKTCWIWKSPFSANQKHFNRFTETHCPTWSRRLERFPCHLRRHRCNGNWNHARVASRARASAPATVPCTRIHLPADMRPTKRRKWATVHWAMATVSIAESVRETHVSIWIVKWTRWPSGRIASNRWQAIRPTTKVDSVQWIRFIMRISPPCYLHRHWIQQWFPISFWWMPTRMRWAKDPRPSMICTKLTIIWKTVFSVAAQCRTSKPVCRLCISDGSRHHQYHRRRILPHSTHCKHPPMAKTRNPAYTCFGCEVRAIDPGRVCWSRLRYE